MANLDLGQNLQILSELFGKVSRFGEDLDKFINGKERRKLAKLGDQSTLIQLEWYEEMRWKFGKTEGLVDDLVDEEFEPE